MTPREKREAAERLFIGPYGVLSSASQGRARPEEPCDIRTCFQRDVDRITHSKAFRRLKHKTQVFLQPEGDHYRTRLTHTLEVSRIARTIARALLLNEDLTEAIALGHDLGHTPFGHAGERALAVISPFGFKHNEQSLRVVDRVEKDGEGLNLCYETRTGILSHTSGATADSLEAKAVRLADRIAYINHDVDDAERAGIIGPGELPQIVRERIGERHSLRINAILRDIIRFSPVDDIAMSPQMAEAVAVFHDFMFQAVYLNPVAKGEEPKVEDILRGIWKYYVNHPDRLPPEYQAIAEEDGLERAVCDYVSGMTDKYAIYQFGEIYIPAAWTVR
ncbi:MAG: deoxyguanosinetriphosphate triphosphohydrolase [Firmicutes bacterium]|nr:deoxyguanosinetriphosphate triphosphohydrolase [Bacillota bacterium]